ncbi:MAG TPA: LON peptidase substrate-binding domain-containing protein [Spirochaetota bacterium]|nr:LON peptidase substrate-binding domain-containing protein [Spirochaetota bacterium]
MKEKSLPIIFLQKQVVFPYCNVSFSSGNKNLAKISQGDRVVALPVRTVLDVLFPSGRMATLSEVVEIKREERAWSVHLKGISRVRLGRLSRFANAVYEGVDEVERPGQERLREDLRKKSQELIFLINVNESDKLIHLLNFLVNLPQLADFVSNYFILKFPRRYEIFIEGDVELRARKLLAVLDDLIADLKAKRERERE